MRSFLLIVLSVLLLAVSSPEAAARSAEMTPPTELTLTGADGQPLAADRVRAAILAGAASMGYPWVPQNESPGRAHHRQAAALVVGEPAVPCPARDRGGRGDRRDRDAGWRRRQFNPSPLPSRRPARAGRAMSCSSGGSRRCRRA